MTLEVIYYFSQIFAVVGVLPGTADFQGRLDYVSIGAMPGSAFAIARW